MEERDGCVVGVDLGSTTVKAVAFDAAGRPFARAAETLEMWHDTSGAAEQDPAAVARAALRALGAVARAAEAQGARVARVGVSAAMHSLIPVAADGTPLARAMLWMDQRPAHVAQALWATRQGKDLYARTGAPIHAMTPLAKLIWLRTEQPALFAQATRLVSLKEWLWHAWFGVWEIDPGMAGATGLYNLRTRDWDAGALALAGIAASRLSTLVPATTTRREPLDAGLAQAGLGREVAYTIASTDGVLANLGVGAISPGELVLGIGTSLAVRAGSLEPRTDEATRLFCYSLDERHYVVGGPSNSGGVVLDWLYRHVLRGPDVAAELTTEHMPSGFVALLNAAGDAHDRDLICLPYVAGERAPLWDADATATFHGLRLTHTSAHLLRAAVEGMIFNALWIAEPLLREPGGAPPRRVVATGQVLETAWIRQVVADVFALPVVYLGDVDASVLGAAVLANLTAGVWTWDDVTARRHLPEGATIQPSAGDDYREPYARFRRVCAALRQVDS